MPGFTPVPKVGEVPSGGGGTFIIGVVVGVVVPVPGGSVPPAVLKFAASKELNSRKRATNSQKSLVIFKLSHLSNNFTNQPI